MASKTRKYFQAAEFEKKNSKTLGLSHLTIHSLTDHSQKVNKAAHGHQSIGVHSFCTLLFLLSPNKLFLFFMQWNHIEV